MWRTTLGDKPLLLTAEKLFETMGLPPGEAHIHRYIGRYERGWKLQRRQGDKREDLTGMHATKDSLWRAMRDADHMLHKIAVGISRDF